MEIPGVCKDFHIYKARKFACKSIKGSAANSGIRVIYEYAAEESKVVFIEIYFKGDKENEDRKRIRRYCKFRRGKDNKRDTASSV